MDGQKKQVVIFRALTFLALVLLIAVYFMPVWWVSLTAPNYPKETFPDGIRIHFHFNGVFNGCKATPGGAKRSETLQADLGDDLAEREQKTRDHGGQEVGLDCVHEMNTINHYVGMYPIASGGPIERNFSPYFFGFFTVMLLGFMVMDRRKQVAVLGVGFAAVAAWMTVELYAMGGLAKLVEDYATAASTYFREPEKIAGWSENLRLAAQITFAGLIAAMAIVVVGVWKSRPFSLLLALVPALLPVFFVLDYAGWLWFFGHNLNPWGAFTVKPFMPTVFGEGKVAQFSTYSYPYYGYGVLVAIFVLLMLALLIRRKLMRQGDAA